MNDTNKCVVNENIIDDCKFLKEDMSETELKLFNYALKVASERLLLTNTDTYPIIWWKSQTDFSILWPVVKMLLAIPATSTESERGFSSSGFILDNLRTQITLPHFCMEYRVSQFLKCGNKNSTSTVTDRMNSILERDR